MAESTSDPGARTLLVAEPPVARLLLLVSRWFDEAVRGELTRRGWPSLSSAQSLVFANLQGDSIPPAELARRLGTTRQATHELVRGLSRLGLVALQENPGRRKGRLVCLTDQGLALARDAYQVLLALEDRLGPDRMAALRRLLMDLALNSHIPVETAASGQESMR